MIHITDYKKRKIQFSVERKNHIVENHPEMINQIKSIEETWQSPDCIIQSNTDPGVELFNKFYKSTPVSAKYLCVVVKFINDGNFIITGYFTDEIKKGKLLWTKK